jgi:glutathione synthase/RimK-type ligase-like ATP-grasp enzyme
VVYKALAGLPGAWRETRKLGTDELSHLDDVSLAPLILQELIEGNDLRVTVVGDDVFAAEMDTAHSRYPYDIRMDMTVPIRPVELDDKTQEALHRFMQRLGLFYGACDFRRRPDGKFIFLEINPAGQFLHIEKLSGLPISHALAALLLQPL